MIMFLGHGPRMVRVKLTRTSPDQFSFRTTDSDVARGKADWAELATRNRVAELIIKGNIFQWTSSIFKKTSLPFGELWQHLDSKIILWCRAWLAQQFARM
jgi:hypothetical protein